LIADEAGLTTAMDAEWFAPSTGHVEMTITLPQLAVRLDQFVLQVHELSAKVADLEALRLGQQFSLAWLREVHPFYTVTLLNLAHALYAGSTALLASDSPDSPVNDGALVTDFERDFLARLCRTVDASLGDRGFTIAKLAKSMGRSPRQLQRDVVRLTGLGPRDILRTRRMTRAQAMLRSHQFRTVAEVADRVGMTSSHFSRAYTAWAGHPPSDEQVDAAPRLQGSDIMMPGSDIARQGRSAPDVM
jgi:AraC-like DNA-binding protein